MSADIFRDRSEGVNARRLDLLRKRRDELITMPHAVRRVVVARSARSAASMVAIAGGAAMVLAAAVPAVTSVLASVLPGTHPAVLSQLLLATWFLTITAYAMARSRAEHRFIVTLSTCVLPGDDADHDVERLSNEHPDAIAKGMAHRLEVRSAALPVIAAALLLPATALYVIDSIRTGGWPEFYELRLEAEASSLAALGVFALVLGVAMTWRRARTPAAGTVVLALAFMAVFILPIAVISVGDTPLWMLAPPLLACTIALVTRRLARERTLIDASDAAAGSELFSWKKAFARARTAITQVPRNAVVGAAACGAALVLGGEPIAFEEPGSTASAVVAATPAVTPPPVAAVAAPGDGATADSVVMPREMVAEVDVREGVVNELTEIAGFRELPAGWRMRVTVRVLEPAPGDVRVRASGFGSARYRTAADGTTVSMLDFTACGTATNLGLRVEPTGTWSRRIKLGITPSLEYSGCE